MAAMVFLLAEKTGWSVDYILWQIPISILHQSNHVFMWANGIRVRKKIGHNSEASLEIRSILGV
jgi:hypothetical protein